MSNFLHARILRDVEGLARTIRRVQVGVHSVANGDTEDVVQEALARAIKSGVSLEAEQWLRTVAKRVAIDQHRRRRETPSGAPTELERYAPAIEGNPEDAFIRAERSAAVREALAALPPRYRTALEAYSEEDSPAGVANRLGLSAAATWTLLSRARSRLRLQLEQAGFVPALVSMARARWRGIATAGAAAGVAATAAIIPHAINTPNTPAAPHVLHVASPSASSATAPSSKPLLPVAPGSVKDTVNKTVDGVKSTASPKLAAVQTCLLFDQVKVNVEVLEDPADSRAALNNSLNQLVKSLPEPLRIIGEKACR